MLSVQGCPPNWLHLRFYSSFETLPVPGQAAKMGLRTSPNLRSQLLPLHVHPWLWVWPAEHRLRAPALPFGHVPRKDARGLLLHLLPVGSAPWGAGSTSEQPRPSRSGLPGVQADRRRSFAIFFPPSSESRARFLKVSREMSKIDLARCAFSVAE